MPKPEIRLAEQSTDDGVIFFGTSADSTYEALDILREEGIHIDALRVRAFPFNQEVEAFLRNHQRIFVVEQNRDAQMRTLLINECDTDPRKLLKVLSYDGMPITARWISDHVRAVLQTNNVVPISAEQIARQSEA